MGHKAQILAYATEGGQGDNASGEALRGGDIPQFYIHTRIYHIIICELSSGA